MSNWSGKMVICKEPCVLGKHAFLQMNGDYEVADDRHGFLLIKAYMRLPNVGTVHGWWRKDRFQLAEEVHSAQA